MPLPSTRSVLRARGALLVALAPLVGCRSAPTAAPPVTASTEAPAPASSGAEAPVVQGREAPSMPVCTASDALVAAPLAESLAATPALARNGATGLVAFITRPDNGPDPVLALLSLNAEGAPTDASGSLRDPRIVSDAGASPTGPALVAHEDGYLLVWRHGTRGQHGLSALRLDAEGAPRGAVTALVRPGGTLGVPAVAVDARGGRWGGRHACLGGCWLRHGGPRGPRGAAPGDRRACGRRVGRRRAGARAAADRGRRGVRHPRAARGGRRGRAEPPACRRRGPRPRGPRPRPPRRDAPRRRRRALGVARARGPSRRGAAGGHPA
jgi:hypothetical protein